MSTKDCVLAYGSDKWYKDGVKQSHGGGNEESNIPGLH